MNHIFATVIFGLAASLCWGSGDFSGGLASRRANTSSVVIAAYAVGFVLLVTLALIWKEPVPGPVDLLWGGLAGVAGVLGLLSFYSALSIDLGISKRSTDSTSLFPWEGTWSGTVKPLQRLIGRICWI
jgi:drug/metabolite transporter (DMT)-like permease